MRSHISRVLSLNLNLESVQIFMKGIFLTGISCQSRASAEVRNECRRKVDEAVSASVLTSLSGFSHPKNIIEPLQRRENLGYFRADNRP